ncbi:nucleotidyltransferase domain-containing protein [Sulfurimonas sp. SAG-AH-194-C21]|nr:nucleotidyltransferase domain-containing protein [Sulfurimonas sp. SAG-AH-194-C21]MDF1884207.1 nucleotidyltransferase domain-containing protein [Sulfurimonas sp. SAG-AH-194-C21]
MRLDKIVHQKIVEYSKEYFNDFEMYLFGSRVDDTKKGGDIDLFIDSKSEIPLSIQMQFLKQLYKNVTQRKIDLVVKSPLKKDMAIFHTAVTTGVKLC